MRVGPLEKLVIRAFRDKEVTAEEIDSFTAPINPESLEESVRIRYNQDQALGAEGNDLRYKGTDPAQLTLKLLLDNTGVVEGNRMEGTPVPEQLAALRRVVETMDPKSHKPPYLKVTYNRFNFDGVLRDIKVVPQKYNSLGIPIRVLVTLLIGKYKEPVRRVRDENKESPDLTHIRQAKEGDNLPLMSYRIYGDTRYYLQVARVNGLTNFRKLRVGSQVTFPAVDKEING